MIDFEQYWRDIREEHRLGIQAGLDLRIDRRDESASSGESTWSVDWLRFSSAAGSTVHGWVARPSNHRSSGAGMLWLPGYSYGTPPPDATNLVPGAITLCINVHGNMPDAPYINPAGKNDYIVRGIETPSGFIYRAIALHCLGAMDALAMLDGVDPGRTVVAGMSQGGALALIVAANHPGPKLCFADMPFPCSVRLALRISRGPVFKEIARLIEANPAAAETMIDTLCLFDPLYHAPSITIPVHITAGGKDPTSRVATIEPVRAAIGSTIKQYRLFPEAGHVFLPEMAQTYANWIDKYVVSRE
jgi:cephalosporin-C deacetylase